MINRLEAFLAMAGATLCLLDSVCLERTGIAIGYYRVQKGVTSGAFHEVVRLRRHPCRARRPYPA